MKNIILFYACLWVTLWFFGATGRGSEFVGLLKTGANVLGFWNFTPPSSNCYDGVNENGQFEICIRR